MMTMKMPFGKHKDKVLSEVPGSYLEWLTRTCKLSSGMKLAVVEELTRRGISTPPAAPVRPVRRCHEHPNAVPVCYWMQDRLGRKMIRGQCPVCHRRTDHPPIMPPYSDQADANQSKTALLDTLTRLEEIGVDLQSDGQTAWIASADYNRVPADLHTLIRQCRHKLARMIGNTMRATRA
jgi:uncharacterized protein (DUF3820 family)